MPTYEYECKACTLKFEREQVITEAPLGLCPRCGGEVRRLVSGGSGYILKERGKGRVGRQSGGCSYEREGKTCCGRDDRCEKPPCGEDE